MKKQPHGDDDDDFRLEAESERPQYSTSADLGQDKPASEQPRAPQPKPPAKADAPRTCPNCGEPVGTHATACLACGQPLARMERPAAAAAAETPPEEVRWWPYAAGLGVIAVLAIVALVWTLWPAPLAGRWEAKLETPAGRDISRSPRLLVQFHEDGRVVTSQNWQGTYQRQGRKLQLHLTYGDLSQDVEAEIVELTAHTLRLSTFPGIDREVAFERVATPQE